MIVPGTFKMLKGEIHNGRNYEGQIEFEEPFQ
jgi:hypothetical protein